MTAAELLVSDLRQRGIDWMATLCGHGLDPLFQAARKAGMRLENARAEAPAAKPAPLTTRPAAPDLNFQDVASSLASARSPLVIAGSGLFYGEAGHAMLRFCETCRVPVVTPIWDRGSVDRSSPV